MQSTSSNVSPTLAFGKTVPQTGKATTSTSLLGSATHAPLTSGYRTKKYETYKHSKSSPPPTSTIRTTSSLAIVDSTSAYRLSKPTTLHDRRATTRLVMFLIPTNHAPSLAPARTQPTNHLQPPAQDSLD
ncbi:hypothetical protein CcaverHIS631_0608870 [Cutaneotrichosporon cavernicola]|nr:hypothetical protein CcaverHIS631_0608870 [Cutaneotrichosporon cavernicola]